MKFAGPKGNCADKLDWESADCADLKICVIEDTTHWEVAIDLFPENVLVRSKDNDDFGTFLESGKYSCICDM